MEQQFPDNSDRSKNQDTKYNTVKQNPILTEEPSEEDARPKVGRIVSTGAVKRKTPLGKKIKNLIVGDSGHSVWEFVLLEVIIPQTKDIVADAVSQGIEKRLFGDVRSVGRRSGTRPNTGGLSSNVGHVRYDRASAPQQQRPTMSRQGRRRHDIGEIIIPSRGEATEVLDIMFNVVSQFGEITVAELYEMVNISPEYTDRKFGWTNLTGASVVRVPAGYLLDLPTPEALD